MISRAEGWAVKDVDTGINIRTVSDTRRAAIVNWLVVECGVAVSMGHDDLQIEKLWRQLCGASEALPIVVTNVQN